MKTAIDLFCGSGGMSVGAKMALPDLSVRYALDIDKHATRTFKAAHPEAYVDCADVATVSAEDIVKYGSLTKIDYLFAGPTCQAVSTMGSFNVLDKRNHLFFHFARLLRGLITLNRPPETVIMENVPGILYGSHNKRIVRDIFGLLESEGYGVFADVLNLAELGLPQLRHRFFLVARWKSNGRKSFPKAKFIDADEGKLPRYLTVEAAISDLHDLPPQHDGEATAVSCGASTEYQKLLRGKSTIIHNHWSAETSEQNIQRIASIPEGGNWKDIPCGLLPERLRRVRMTDYATVYGRLHWDNPAYTVSASFSNPTSGCFIHPTHDRVLTVREGARLQGFPDDVQFLGPRLSQYRQVGNAVPPYAMAQLINYLVDENSSEGTPALLDPEVLRSDKKLPPMTSRFRTRRSASKSGRQGYGGSTFWPVGWGPAPESLPDHTTQYHREPAEIERQRRYRRRDEMRPLADLALFDEVLEDWISVAPTSRSRPEETVFVLDTAAETDGTTVLLHLLRAVESLSGACWIQAPLAVLGQQLVELARLASDRGIETFASIEWCESTERIRWGAADNSSPVVPIILDRIDAVATPISGPIARTDQAKTEFI
ncbi:MAG: DNA cytosine methyltransferase [Pseudomonadota bacterium]